MLTVQWSFRTVKGTTEVKERFSCSNQGAGSSWEEAFHAQEDGIAHEPRFQAFLDSSQSRKFGSCYVLLPPWAFWLRSPIWVFISVHLCRVVLAPLLEAFSLCFFRLLPVMVFRPLFLGKKGKSETAEWSHPKLGKRVGQISEDTTPVILCVYGDSLGVLCLLREFRKLPFQFLEISILLLAVLHLSYLVLFGNHIERYILMERNDHCNYRG